MSALLDAPTGGAAHTRGRERTQVTPGQDSHALFSARIVGLSSFIVIVETLIMCRYNATERSADVQSMEIRRSEQQVSIIIVWAGKLSS